MEKPTVEGIKVHLIEDDFMHTEYEDKFLINPGHLENMRKLYTHVLGSDNLENIRLLVEFKGSIEISHDVSERYLTDRIRVKKGEALVSNNARTLEFLNGASAIMGRTHPVKVFDTVEEAKVWLLSL